MSIGYWILAITGGLVFLGIVGALCPPLGKFLVEFICSILESIGDD